MPYEALQGPYKAHNGLIRLCIVSVVSCCFIIMALLDCFWTSWWLMLGQFGPKNGDHNLVKTSSNGVHCVMGSLRAL